ncbi:MAG: SusD/RagB family nutrient-binding outer membrane lipoprotein [Dysgonamonadaceae bacterium]|jgi:hypothetical protein|nr:SusD/RagB family nutrient-binding outer membrane lipoprotein [Dysgonamonadaceae bacterium]
MKKQIYQAALSVLLIITAVLGGCTDNFEEINSNPNKLYNTDFKYIFPGTVYKTLKLFGDMNYNYFLNNSRLVTIQFKTVPNEDTGDTYFRQAYIDILRDLEQVEKDYTGKEGHQNRLAMVKTWKAYVYYLMASLYGPIPMSDALLDDGESRITFRYDSEAQVYAQILALLKEAADGYQPASQYLSTDCLTPDYVFNQTQSNIAKWQKFTATFRLNMAMHVQNLLPELAQQHATEVMQQENLLIASNDENVAPHFGTDKTYDVSYYYNRFLRDIESTGIWSDYIYPTLSEYFALYLFSYSDPRIESWFVHSNDGATAAEEPFLFTDTITREHVCTNTGNDRCPDYAAHRADGLNAYRRDSILVDYSVPYLPISESQRLPPDWEIAVIPGTINTRYSDPIKGNTRFQYSRVKPDFIKTDASVVLFNYADACFLKAEAKIKFGLGAQSAQDYYEEGIRASFTQYGMGNKAGDYLAQDGIKWDTNGHGYLDRMGFYAADVHGAGSDERHLEQIYKQRAFGSFFNGLEGWNVERRTRAFRWPPVFNSNMNIEGMVSSAYSFGRERLNYPLSEIARNGEEYYRAVQLLQAASPYGNASARWGDNTVTALAFTKIDPETAVAAGKYAGHRQIVYHAHYFCNYWGTTYEELVDTARAMTGETSAARALTKAFNYKFVSRLNTYGGELIINN